MKSAQVMYDKKPIQSWVAEVYEPYFHNKNPENCWYKIIQEDELEGMEEPPKGRKKVCMFNYSLFIVIFQIIRIKFDNTKWSKPHSIRDTF